MKKLAICGIALVACGTASLFIGGIAKAPASFQTITLTAEITILDEGVDEGGRYLIIDNGRECRKVYPKTTSSPGMVD